MQNLIYYDTAAQLVSKHPVQVLKLEMRSNDSATAGFWQVHDFAPSANVAVPAEGAIPVKSWPTNAGAPDYKEFKNGELVLKQGLYVCYSTTEATKTLGTGSNKFAMLSVELDAVDEFSIVLAQGGALKQLQVWAESAGPKKLLRVKVTNLDAAVRYLMLFANDTVSDGDRPLASWTLAANGDSGGLDSKELNFGNGRDVTDVLAGAVRKGCTFKLSTTPKTLTLSTDTGMDIYAEKM